MLIKLSESVKRQYGAFLESWPAQQNGLLPVFIYIHTLSWIVFLDAAFWESASLNYQ